MDVPVIAEHIEITPGTCGGKPRIKGHRIKVQHVATWHEDMGMSAEEIVATYPDITLGDVHAALAYYYDHRAEIRAQLRADDEFVRELQALQPSLLERLKARIDAQGDPIPPR